MSATWNTKYGTRRVRHDPPTLQEAIAAAQGLTDDVAGQVGIAADLMGVSAAEVKSLMAKLNPDKRAVRIVATPSRDNGVRTVVVERKASRRVVSRNEIANGESGASGVTRAAAPRAALERRQVTIKA